MAAPTVVGAGRSRPAPVTPPGRRAPGRRRDRAVYALYLVPGLIAFVAVIGVPFVMNIGISLTRWSGVGPAEWIGLDNYRRLLTDEAFWASFRHNVVLIVAMAVVPTAIGLVVAAALFDVVGKRFGSRSASILRACIYLPQLLPIAVAGIVWGWILAADQGALNAALGAGGLGSWARDWLGDPAFALFSVAVILVWVQLGYPVVIFMAGLQRVDPELYEAAEIDGASWWRRFWHLTLPQIRPEIFVVLLWCTIAALKVFGPIFVLTRGGPGGATTVPAYLSYSNFFEKTQVGYGSAIATVLAAIILALTLVFLRVQARSDGER